MQAVRNDLTGRIVKQKEAECKDLENFQPIHIAKNENTEGMAQALIRSV